ncbi:WhiB family transcriptional regulator [Microbispora amethystogenes]|uniref:WhiB family transcriptional regulator n=1 Tax=Microbispora amethystogenes TaxID=1427754 RepID=UPI0033DB6780
MTADALTALFGGEEPVALLAAVLDAGPACKAADADLFTGPDIDDEPDEARQAREAAAKAICRTCPARPACLNYALTARPRTGVWGAYAAEEINAAHLLRLDLPPVLGEVA